MLQKKWKMIIAYVGIAFGIGIITSFTIEAQLNSAKQSQQVMPDLRVIPVDTSYTWVYDNKSYYSFLYKIDATNQQPIQFDNVIFIYKGSIPVADHECNANKVDSTFNDYNASEVKRFEIIANGSTTQVNTCWPPPYTSQLPEYQAELLKSDHGIDTLGVGCPVVYFWDNNETKNAAIAVQLGEGQWQLGSGKIYKLYCNQGLPSIHYIVKASGYP